jgi:phosphate transport system ATP-binding protein
MTDPTITGAVDASPEPDRVAIPQAEVLHHAADHDTLPVVFEVRDLAAYYGTFKAVREVTLDVRQHEITAFIGPSGCGKTTVLRCFNRMNDLIPGAHNEGTLNYHGTPLYGPGVDPVEVRRRIGMVFQKPNPFPKSIYDNVAYGPRLHGRKRKADLEAAHDVGLEHDAHGRDLDALVDGVHGGPHTVNG